ncbi:class I SAM-dependent methyltransferase [bacterium]|nr:class I SAM-dependent methyltransferase [bacterium]
MTRAYIMTIRAVPGVGEVSMQELYSHDDIRNTYEPIRDHMMAKEIIQEFALNQSDIRDVALEGLDLGDITRVLDIGCGYGFFTEKLKDRLCEGARIHGLDAVEMNNREMFLDTVQAMGYHGEFIHARADAVREMPASSFDLVVASYSLYFVPQLIPDIARILTPEGLFISVTHSRHSLKEVTRYIPRSMEMMGLDPPPEIAINRLLKAFSLENGNEMLSPHFRSVELIVFPNDLLFPFDRIMECINYLDKKKYLIMKDVSENYPQRLEDMLGYFNAMVYDHARLHGEIIITKDDAVFRCFYPRKADEME